MRRCHQKVPMTKPLRGFHITEFALSAFISIEGLLRSQIPEGHIATRDELSILP